MTAVADAPARSGWRTPLALLQRRGTLGLMVRQDLKVYYGRYRLGLLWTMAEPFAQALFMWIVFALIFQSTRGITVEPFIVYLVTGLIPLAWLQASITGSTRAYRMHRRAMTTSVLPEVVWPLRVVLKGLADLVLALPVVVVFVIVFHLFTGEPGITWGVLLFPVGILLQLLLCTGLAMMGMALSVGFPDVERMTSLINRFFFWMSPVIWSQRNFPEWVQSWLYLNPFHGVLDCYRAAFWPELLAEPRAYVMTSLVILVIFGTGAWMLQRSVGRIRRGDV